MINRESIAWFGEQLEKSLVTTDLEIKEDEQMLYYMFNQMRKGESSDLLEAIVRKDWDNVIKEASIISIFAMMIALSAKEKSELTS